MGRPRAELVRDREKEVKCLMNWILDNPFVLSVSFHDGRYSDKNHTNNTICLD